MENATEPTDEIRKVVRDGEVAVLISPGYGAGWYTWHGEEALLFHPAIVELVEQGKREEITMDLCQRLMGKNEYICALGAEDLCIEWLPIGTAFYIEEYDGSETLITSDDFKLIA